MENVRLTFAQDALTEVATQAIKRKTGARGLRAILENILLDTMFDIPSAKGLEEVVINANTVQGNAEPLKIFTDNVGGAAVSSKPEKAEKPTKKAS